MSSSSFNFRTAKPISPISNLVFCPYLYGRYSKFKCLDASKGWQGRRHARICTHNLWSSPRRNSADIGTRHDEEFINKCKMVCFFCSFLSLPSSHFHASASSAAPVGKFCGWNHYMRGTKELGTSWSSNAATADQLPQTWANFSALSRYPQGRRGKWCLGMPGVRHPPDKYLLLPAIWEPETITSTTMASNTVTKITHTFSLSHKEGTDEQHIY